MPRGLTVKSIETFRRESLALVRITASDGKSGWGQIAPYEADISAEVLHRLIARLVIGRDISEIDAINDAVIDAQLKFPWSFLCRALAGVDTALWDLYGQITGKPVAVLLGGSVRPLPAYGSSMRRDISPADEATRLARLRDQFGCKAFKIRLGTPGGRNRDAAPGRSEAIIPAVRKAVGPAIELHADANSCYTPDVAIPMGRRLEDSGYAAFEEPCPYWELEWTQEVTRALSIDVQGGEQDNDMAQWRRMIAMRAVDIVQPDICYVGGLTRAWRVAKMAEAAGLVTKPHAANVSLVTVFTMHLLAALPKAGAVEFSIEDDAAITKQAQGDVRSRAGDEGRPCGDAGRSGMGRTHQGRLAGSRGAPGQSGVGIRAGVLLTLQSPRDQRALEERRQVLGFGRPRRQLGDAVLRQCARDERGYVTRRVANGLQPIGHLEPLHEPGDAVRKNAAGVGVLHASDVGAQCRRRFEVTRWVRRRRESEHRRRVQDHRDSMRHERMIARVAGGAKLLHVARKPDRTSRAAGARRHCRTRRRHTTRPESSARAPRRLTDLRRRERGTRATMRRACSAQMSLIGFDPW